MLGAGVLLPGKHMCLCLLLLLLLSLVMLFVVVCAPRLPLNVMMVFVVVVVVVHTPKAVPHIGVVLLLLLSRAAPRGSGSTRSTTHPLPLTSGTSRNSATTLTSGHAPFTPWSSSWGLPRVQRQVLAPHLAPPHGGRGVCGLCDIWWVWSDNC